MKKHRVLVDLSIAMNNGYCGIAKENRLIFKLLADNEEMQLNGLLTSSNISTVFSKYQKPTSLDQAIEQANRFFHEALLHEPWLKAKFLKKLRFAKHFFLRKKDFQLFDIDPLFHNAIWRNVFNKSLGASDRQAILSNQFVFSNFTSLHAGAASYFKRPLRLDTSQHDVAIFLEPTAVAVSPNTIKMVRYHDAIPITDPDFLGTVHSQNNMHALQLCEKDSYFICNSEPTLNVLLTLKPALESKAFMVPVGITNHYQRIQNETILKQILLTRLSTKVVKAEHLPFIRQNIQEWQEVKYIFNLAAFDPKKNITSVISAWEKLRYQHHAQVKLVIAANSGWFSKEIEQMMLPHIMLGNIIHVDNLSMDELPYLFSHAELFLFPSYTEGFGLPPLEASQCACPVVVSDIPAHRWVMGEGALYCDPYDTDSIVDVLTQLLFADDKENRKQRLLNAAFHNLNRFSTDTLAAAWREVFKRIAYPSRHALRSSG